jgi:hypothetical protein
LYQLQKNQDNSDKNPTSSNDIVGSWELRKTSGGMMRDLKSYPDGNGN